MNYRYAVELSAYVYATSDEEAKQKAKELAETLNAHALEDPQTQTIKLSKIEFGSLDPQEIQL